MDQNNKPGMSCPQCGAFIEVSVHQLLAGNGLECPACGLHLNLDRTKSQSALDALKKVERAQQNLEKEKFNRR